MSILSANIGCQFLIQSNVQEKTLTQKDFDINFDMSVIKANANRTDFPFCESDVIFAYDSQWVVRVFLNGVSAETVGRVFVVLKGMSEKILPIDVEYTIKAASNNIIIAPQIRSLSISSPIEAIDAGVGGTGYLMKGDSIYLSKEANIFQLHLTLKTTQAYKSVYDDISYQRCGLLRDRLFHKATSDVDIVVEGTRIPAHKLILSLVSPVFTAMFENQMQESVSNEIVISDFSEEVVRSMLRCIYDSSVVKSEMEKHADQLLLISNKYELTELEQSATAHISRNITVDNAIHVLLSADKFDRAQIKSAAMNFIVNNADHFFALSDFSSSLGHVMMNEILGYMIANKRVKY